MPEDFAQTQPPTGLGPKAGLGIIVSHSFPSDFRWVRRIIHQTTEALSKNGLSAEAVGSVEIVLAEALNNIVEHAYEEEAPGDINLVIKQRRSSLLFEISDKGNAMPNGRAPLGNHPMSEFNNDPMPEGGYGWFLIRELVRDLIYDRRDDQNFLIFRMAIESPSEETPEPEG
ncbi:MAG: ATP-binding protein [Paracoccaceae bacterium]